MSSATMMMDTGGGGVQLLSPAPLLSSVNEMAAAANPQQSDLNIGIEQQQQQQQRRYSFHKLKMKLGSASGKLYGREEEEELLRQSFSRCVLDHKQELILISGNPGTGKSALATTLKSVVAKEKGFFVAGKFEEQAICEPYEVFISALTDYTDQFLDASDDVRLEQVRKVVQQAVGNEGKLLTDMIPALKNLIVPESNLPEQSTTTTTTTSSKTNGSSSKYKNASSAAASSALPTNTAAKVNRFRIVFCNFVRALTQMAPLVLFLDDLQWADTASCEMVRNLMHTKGPAGAGGRAGAGMPLLIVGAHRCDLNPEEKKKEDPTQVVCVACMQMKPFVATMMDLEKERHTEHLRMQSIDLKDLKADAVNVLLQDLLGKTETDTKQLADVVILQTRGNIFHILQFVRLLLDQEFLTKNAEDKWKWNIDTIMSKLRTETIMDIVQQSILELPRLAQEALKVASCMGDEIDDSALDLVLQTPVGNYLEQAAVEGLLVFYPQFGGYRFAHDWIRQTAYEMTPKEEREEFHLKIGRKLWKASNALAIQKNIFVVVSLLNKGIKFMKEERERYKVAELNLQAAEKAAAVSAFPNASKFSRRGIQLLSRNRWNDYYELTLSLFSLAAEVEAINGNYERVVLYIEEIINKGRCLEDKLRAYAALIRSMGQQDNLQEATAVGIDVLGQLGEPVPKPTRFNIMKEMARVKMALRGRTTHDLLNLPMMRHSIKSATLQILNLIFMSSFQARSQYTPLIALRAISLTMKFGMHEASSVAFAAFAVMLCGLEGDVKSARRYGDVAIEMAENMNSKEYTPIVYYLVGSGVTHWSSPIQDTFENLLYASKTAMEVGDAEVAVLAKTTHCIHRIFSGTSLSEVEDEIDQCIRTARLYRKQSTQQLALITLQLIQCWMGKSKNPAVLTGMSINYEAVLKDCLENHNHQWIAILKFFSLELAYSFGEFDLAHTMMSMDNYNRDEKASGSSYSHVEMRYKEGLVAVAMARRGTNKSRNIKYAKEILKTLTKWARFGPSYVGKQQLLDAEIQSLKGNRYKSKIYPLYEAALKSAKDSRCEKALVAERLADYKMLCGDTESALQLYNQAIDLYRDWGAKAKVVSMESYVKRIQK